MLAALRQISLAGVSVALLAGCRDTASRHNPYPKDSAKWGLEEARRCTFDTTQNGHPVTVFFPERDCAELGEPRVQSGVWLNDFEGSQFFIGVKTAEQARHLRHAQEQAYAANAPLKLQGVWLELNSRALGEQLPGTSDGSAYAVTMLAYNAPCRSGLVGYGTGNYAGLVVPHFVLALKRLD